MATGILYLSIGAILGAILRFLINHYSSELSHHHGFPFGTLVVNVLGSFIVGYVLTWTADHEHDYWRLFTATGFCGAFTTFSAFAYETLAYWHEGRYGTFVINAVLTNILCVVAVALGIWTHDSV
jgi:fluoride exporter